MRRCGECGEQRTAHARARDGEPDLCFRCWSSRRQAARSAASTVAPTGRDRSGPTCPRCIPEPRARCSHCDKRGQIAALTDRGPQCLACWREARNGRHACQRCRRRRRPAAWIDGAPVCAACNGTGTLICQDCGLDGHDFRTKRCHRCALNHTSRSSASTGIRTRSQARAAPSPARAARQTAKRAQVAAAQRCRPYSVAMLRGELAISHETLDEHAATRGDRLPALVAGDRRHPGGPPGAPGQVRALGADDVHAIGEHPDHAHQPPTRAGSCSPTSPAGSIAASRSASSHRHLYGKLRIAVHLTTWLHGQGLSLSDLRQSHVDAWLAGMPGRPVATRGFVDWLHRARLIPRITVVRPAPRTSTTPIDHSTRLRQARDLLHDDALELPARIGGCLLLLYGQPATRIVILRLDQVHLEQERVLLQLGEEPIELPPPLGSLVQTTRSRQRTVAVPRGQARHTPRPRAALPPPTATGHSSRHCASRRAARARRSSPRTDPRRTTRLPRRHHEPLATCRRRRLGPLRQPRQHTIRLSQSFADTSRRALRLVAERRGVLYRDRSTAPARPGDGRRLLESS